MISNYHTHTLYCDGNDKPETIVKTAINKGLNVIGFSGHGFTKFDDSYCMSAKDQKKYIEEIAELKQKYKAAINIFCGVEQDFYAGRPKDNFDFVIGSVHYVKKGEKYLDVDKSREDFCQNIKEYYNGDYFAFAADYFNNVAEVKEKTDCDIIGHFDLVSKFNENNLLFDENNENYLKYGVSAIENICKSPSIFEINTGAMARGYKTTPYPSRQFLKEIKSHGGRVIITSDCHNAADIDFGYESALLLAKECGFKDDEILNYL